MIMSVDELKLRVDTGDMDDSTISQTLKSIEDVIRTYCNNNFQNRNVRFVARSEGGILNNASEYIRIGDTIQITQSEVNDGLYTVVDVRGGYTSLDTELFDVPFNRVTKVEYPSGVLDVAVSLFKWKQEFGMKIGIKSESETLSRHSQSVTYEDSSSLVMGFPQGILSGLALWEKARC